MNECILRNIPALGVANRVISGCAERDITDFTNMKVQKLVYYTYSLFYRKYEKLLFSPENIMFWKHGPVIVRVYDSLKHHGNRIVDLIKDSDPFTDEGDEGQDYVDIDNREWNEQILKTVDIVLDRIGNKTSLELRTLSHAPHSAWYRLTGNGKNVYVELTSDKLDYIKQEVELTIPDHG